MKLFHLSDLHIGKQLKGNSLLENQKEVLHQIVEAANTVHPDGILICGDVYDKSAPSGEAYMILDNFLDGLAGIEPKIPVLLIAGNHDSQERLKYASSFLERNQIYISTMLPDSEEEYLKKVVLEDEYGMVNFYLLPFLKPGYVRHLFEEGVVTGYESAVKAILSREKVDDTVRNVLLSHQFYIAGGKEPKTCESEQAVITVGGLDHIDISVTDRFDYVALGHLHGAQRVGKETIRYSGTPYKYSVSEEYHKKAITVVTLGKKGEEPEISYIPLNGIQDVRQERGSLSEVLTRATEENCHDFLNVIITDEKEPYNLREQLEEVYDHLLELKIDNARTRSKITDTGEEVLVLRPFESFQKFYETIRNCPMTAEEEKVMMRMIERSKEDDML